MRTLLVGLLVAILMAACSNTKKSSNTKKTDEYDGLIVLEYEIGVFKDMRLVTGRVIRESIQITNGLGVVEGADYKLAITGLARSDGEWTCNTLQIIPASEFSFKVGKINVGYKSHTLGSTNSRMRFDLGQWVTMTGYKDPDNGRILLKTRIVRLEKNG